MRLAARCIATMAVALAMVPALLAGDAAKPKAKTVKEAPPVSIFSPAPGAEAQPIPGNAPPVRLPIGWSSSSGVSAQSAPGSHSGNQSENYTPRIEWSLGYSFWRAMPTSSSNRFGYMHGGSSSVAINLNNYLGLVADFGGFGNSRLTFLDPAGDRTVDSDGTVFTYLFGPRFSYRKHERFTPFAQVLIGAAHASSVTISGCTGDPACTPLGTETAFATMMGAGLDIKLTRHVALRLFEGDFLLTHFKDPFSPGGDSQGWQKNVRLSTGIVLRFGGRPAPPPRAPIAATCSVDKQSVYEGSGDVVAVSAQVSNPDSSPLNYSWSATGGKVDGTGTQVRWDSTGVAPGTYTVTAKVDDAHGQSASCSSDVTVNPKPVPPPTMACSVDRSPVLAGERATITANVNDQSGTPLSYEWKTNGGQIVGSGSSVQLDTTGLAAGDYSVTGRVTNASGGAADCSATVGVQAPPAAAQASKIGSCSFKVGSSRVDNVCKRVLDDAALRLQNDPKATVVLVGYADPGEKKPDMLAKTRGDNAAKYLSQAKGVAESRSQARSAAGQQGAGRENYRVDVIFVPDGATY